MNIDNTSMAFIPSRGMPVDALHESWQLPGLCLLISTLRKSVRALTLLLLVTHAGTVGAHEYWLDPVGTQWQPGDTLQADIRNGQEFSGTRYPFDPQGLARAGLISDRQRRSLTGRLGDYPAIQIPVTDAGLNLLLLETTQRELKYKAYGDFETFLDYHALQPVKQRHMDRGLPTEQIIEHYFRYCKALLNVQPADTSPAISESNTLESARRAPANAAAALQPQDQRFELVPLQNPFEVNSLSLQLLFEQAPLGNRQVELFHRDSRDVVVRSTAVSDEKGLVQFDVSSTGDYLVNSVLVLEPDAPPAHWTTLWASLFFQQTEK